MGGGGSTATPSPTPFPTLTPTYRPTAITSSPTRIPTTWPTYSTCFSQALHEYPPPVILAGTSWTKNSTFHVGSMDSGQSFYPKVR